MSSSFYMRHVEREILSALVDGELEPSLRREVHEHLRECVACRQVADEFGLIHGLVGDLPPLVAPQAFVTRALDPVPRRPVDRLTSAVFAGRRRWVAVGAAAAATAITLGGLAMPQPSAEPPVTALIERHVGTNSVDPGAQVLFAVNGR